MRYNKLHKSAGIEDGGRIWIKTFDSHLKLLVGLKMVEKHEESRYKVFYKLAVSGSVPAKALEEREWWHSFQLEHCTENFSKLYSNHEEVSEKDKEKRLERDLRSILRIMEMSLIDAIHTYAENPAYSYYMIDEAVALFRNSSRAISSIVGQSNETQAFFSPILWRIYLKAQDRWFNYYLGRERYKEKKRLIKEFIEEEDGKHANGDSLA